MATLFETQAGSWRVQFRDGSGARRSVTLGKMSKRRAEGICSRIERLNVCRILGDPIDADDARWIAEQVSEEFAGRLAKAGLIEPPGSREVMTLGEFLDLYLSKRVDAKSPTHITWKQAIRNLKEFFGDDRPLATITPGDADDFRRAMLGKQLGKLARSTVGKRLQIANQFFRDARKRKLIAENPFDGVTVSRKHDESKDRFISREDVIRLLRFCDPTWKMIVALSRFGALRAPSEVCSLEWSAIDWEAGEMIVHSPKTEHHPNGERRIVPIFPELRPYLDEAHALAPDGAVYVIDPKYRRKANGPNGWGGVNLQTQFDRLAVRAGLKPWPKPFVNMRASRATELACEFGLKEAAQWCGHSVEIAARHYQRATEANHARATGKAGAYSVHSLHPDCTQAVSQAHATNGEASSDSSEVEMVSDDTRADGKARQSSRKRSVGREGLEPPTVAV